MIKIAHRINTIEALNSTPEDLGVELDLRPAGNKIIIHHDAFEEGQDFEGYLQHYKHKLMILNTKSEGMEEEILALMKKYSIQDYFLLDLSLPFLVKYAQKGTKNIAIRYSEYEPIDLALNFKGLVDWVWVDCFNGLMLDDASYEALKPHFKICMVSPELQQHPIEWIAEFKDKLKGKEIDAVCTKRPDLW